LRLSVEETEHVARTFAEKLSAAQGPTIFLFPKKGWSAIDCPESHMFCGKDDELFLKVLKENAGTNVIIREVDANLEDDAFAEFLVGACLEIFPRPASKTKHSVETFSDGASPLTGNL
jgi:uncharacterized protein (UPF0261 family)